MTRLVLLVILGFVAMYYFPDSRTVLLDLAEPVLVPMMTWSTKEEMSQIGRNVVEHERLTGQLPGDQDWIPWLQYRYSGEDLWKDPWDSLYRLEIWDDSIAVVSYGPDRERYTADDFQVVMARERR